jgi:hypothetical protein
MTVEKVDPPIYQDTGNRGVQLLYGGWELDKCTYLNVVQIIAHDGQTLYHL